jgi:drug/metabolite transporter (DMT)-like permease
LSPLQLGILMAALAAVLYNAGVAVQAFEARETPRGRSLRLSLLTSLAARRRWLIGTLLVTAGWTLQAAALLFAPLTAVQPTLAAGLLILLVIGARFLHERVGIREVAAVAAICVGLVGLALTSPARTPTQASPIAVGIALTALGAAALLPYLLSRLGRRPGVTVVLSAGLAYAWCGVSTKLVADAAGAGAWAAAVAWVLATAAVAGLGLLSEMTSLQSRPATRVAPVVLVVDIVVAVAFAAVLVGERWDVTPLGGSVLLGAVALLTVGAGVLAASPAVAAVGHPEAAQAADEG